MAEVTKTGENTVKVTVEVPAAEVAARAQEVYAELARNVKYPGFRKGKVPRHILERDYAAQALQAVVDELVPAAFQREAAAAELDPVSAPRFRVLEAAPAGPLKFEAEVAVFPAVELPDYAKFAVKREVPEVTAEDVDQALAALHQANARLEPVEGRAALDDELVVVKFLGKKPPEGFSRETVGIWARAAGGDAFGKQVLGKKAGDRFALEINYPADYPEKRFAGKLEKAPVEVLEVKRRVLPPLGEDFAKELGEESLDALKKKLRRRYEARAVNISYVTAYHRFIGDILARAVVPMSRSFVEQFAASAAAGGEPPSEKERAEQYAAAERELKTYFVIREVAKREGIEVTPDEVRERVAASASAADGQPLRPAEVYDQLLNEKLALKLIPREEDAGGGPAGVKIYVPGDRG
jgi:trigger factor